jgi:DTW domain-containing protein
MPDDASPYRCYKCFRPKESCYCDAIPEIDNRTNVLILQHRRERFHPFNTARIVQRALKNSSLLVGYAQEHAESNLPIQANAGLLYPGPNAKLLSDISPEERPDQLVILDGTWSHAKGMFRDIPALHDLPQFMLAPDSPGRYRIRREPSDTSLSTIEAVASALFALEPETQDLDKLLEAFETMVERQLDHPKSNPVKRRNNKSRGLGTNIPRSLTGDLSSVVVAYGESTPGRRGDKFFNTGAAIHDGEGFKERTKSTECVDIKKEMYKRPIYWAAQRLSTNEQFMAAIEPPVPLSDEMLKHLELTGRDFQDAASHEEFRKAWDEFLRPDDLLVVYHPGTLKLLSHVNANTGKAIALKAISVNSQQATGTLEERLAAEGLVSESPELPGRARKRLAQAITLVRHLNARASEANKASF